MAYTETILNYKDIHYYPHKSQHIRRLTSSRGKCVIKSRNCNELILKHLQNGNELVARPNDGLQKDLDMELLQPGRQKTINTLLNVFSGHLFANATTSKTTCYLPTQNQDYDELSHLPTRIISKRGSSFVSHVIKKIAKAVV